MYYIQIYYIAKIINIYNSGGKIKKIKVIESYNI